MFERLISEMQVQNPFYRDNPLMNRFLKVWFDVALIHESLFLPRLR